MYDHCGAAENSASPSWNEDVGILAQEIPEFRKEDFKPATSFIAASYVKAVEAAGARVVPIFIKQELSYYRKLLKSINGVVAPGGSATLLPGYGYYDALNVIYEIAKEINEMNVYFPVFGICLGLEALLTIANNHTDIQILCNIKHENYPLEFMANYHESLLYSHLPHNIGVYLQYDDVTVNVHRWCTTLQNFSQSSLQNEWVITSLSTNKQGIRFISSVEHNKYPFVAVQFHPEKYFEWSLTQNNPHSKVAILANRYFYDFIVEQSRLNQNKFSKLENEGKALIFNHIPVHSPATKNMGFHQIYVFN